MSQTIYDTRQRTEELLKEALNIWKQENHSEYLEGLEKDPVFELLISAIAWQANESDNEIARLRTEILQEYLTMLTPYEIGHATPATAVLQTFPQAGVGEVRLHAASTFAMGKSNWRFMPLLESRVLPVRIESLARLDGRHWAVNISSSQPLTDLTGLTFAVTNPSFRDLNVSLNGKELPLVRPWEYSELPYTSCFSLENSLYNRMAAFDPAPSCMELFARHDLRIYSIRPHEAKQYLPQEATQLRLVFEFTGTAANFQFERSQLFFNVVLLANATERQVDLDSINPVARITGEGSGKQGEQLMHLIRPSHDQIYEDCRVNVRRVAGDRFNQATLLRLLSAVQDRLRSDFYAFMQLDPRQTSVAIRTIQEQVQRLIRIASENLERSIAGTYLMLDHMSTASVCVKYLTTSGAAVNEELTNDAHFSVPGGLDLASTHQIAPAIRGTNETSSEDNDISLIRYALITGDRIVTPADIKSFCYKELMQRYSITHDMVDSIAVKQTEVGTLDCWHNACGFEIRVEVCLKDTPNLRRKFTDRIPQAELLLEKMMQVRSANIYPIRVTIKLQE
ncbi:MAG: hypothetical protein KBT12_02335 [Bacteroidales bacterium]|nr:hypothetical protein [Candidatus Physcousia equi]